MTEPSKVVASRTSSSSVPFSSFTTCSVASTFTVPSYREKTYGDSFSTKTEEEILFASNSKAFTLNELKSATRNFRTESLIGEGGFGLVYKGWLDEQTLTPTRPGNGTMVAIKKLKLESFQGHKEWLVCYAFKLLTSSLTLLRLVHCVLTSTSNHRPKLTILVSFSIQTWSS